MKKTNLTALIAGLLVAMFSISTASFAKMSEDDLDDLFDIEAYGVVIKVADPADRNCRVAGTSFEYTSSDEDKEDEMREEGKFYRTGYNAAIFVRYDQELTWVVLPCESK